MVSDCMGQKHWWKKTVAFLIGGAMMVMTSAETVEAATVPAGHWAEDSLSLALAEGILPLSANGEVEPDRPIRRGEFVELVNEALLLPEPTSEEAAALLEPFTDIGNDPYIQQQISRALHSGYMTGDGNGLFRPEASITRQEVAVIISRLKQLTQSGHDIHFIDSGDISSWARSAVMAVVRERILGGYPDGSFRPKPVTGKSADWGLLTRSEAVVLVERLARQAEVSYLNRGDGSAVAAKPKAVPATAQAEVVKPAEPSAPVVQAEPEQETVLKAAAAPQARMKVTPAERDLLARLVWAEAQGEPYEGKVAVAAVVFNRVESNLFPNDIWSVVYEPWQFEPVSNGWINKPAPEEAFKAVDDAIAGWDPSGGAIFFFAPDKVTNKFLWARPFIKNIGKHRFTA